MADYISREEAIKELREVYEQEYHTASGDFDEYASHDVPNVLRNMKAADVQPVKHGRWSECYTDTHHYSGICSVCGKASIKSLTESLYAFCPKCGAKMIKDGDTD